MPNYPRLFPVVLFLTACLDSGDGGPDLPYEDDGRVCTSEIPDDGLDQDCDGVDSHACWEDLDGDGYGAGVVQIINEECRAVGLADLGADCAPIDVSLNPEAFDVPGDGIDQDCNGVDAVRCLVDFDGDGFGLADVVSADGLCDAARGHLDLGGALDCDDTDGTAFPGGVETVADGIDQDCSGADTVRCWVDADADTFGAGTPTDEPGGACAAGAVPREGDCDDVDAIRRPDATEIPDDLIDQDCNGVDATACFLDVDADGAFGTPTLGLTGVCDPVAGQAATATDCDDAQPAAFPGNAEICDGVDNDCDPLSVEDGRIDLLGVGLQPDLATAVSLAGDEDVIALCTGTFPANLTIDRDITLRAPASAEVVLDGGGLGPVIEVSAGTVLLENLVLTGGAGRDAGAGVTGGALRVAGGDVLMIGGGLTASTADRGGGAWIAAGASARLESVTIDLNQAVQGGGIAAEGTLTLTSAGVVDNEATDGAGLWVGAGGLAHAFSVTVGPNVAVGDGGGAWIDGTLNLHASSFLGNAATSGGGVRVGALATLAGDQLTLTENTAIAAGGGVLAAGAVDLVDSALIGNDAATGGGAAVETTGSLSLSRATIADNTATEAGGGVHASGALIADEIAFSGNAAATGGGVHATADLVLSRVQIVGNTASVEGAGAWLGANADISDAVIAGNVAVDGGGLFVNTAADLTLSGATLSENAASGLGGGALVLGAANVDHSASLRNTASAGGTWWIASGAWLGLVDTSVREGVAAEGGGVWFAGAGRFERVEIARNEADSGAGLFAQTAAPELILVQFRANTASQDGGGVYARQATLDFTGGDLSDNTAARGGGLFLDNATANGALSQGNTATFGGGAATVGACTLRDGSLHDNDATTGGGAWITGHTRLFGVDVDVNEAPTGAGLAVDSAGLAELAPDTDVFWNHATEGGGVWLAGGASVDGGSVRENTAVRGGGAFVASGSAARAALANLAIFGNQADLGAGVYTVGDCEIQDAAITGNQGLTGGGLWVGASTSVVRAALLRNSAVEGGAAWVHAADLGLEDVDLGVGVDDNAPSDVEVAGNLGSWAYGLVSDVICTVSGGCDA